MDKFPIFKKPKSDKSKPYKAGIPSAFTDTEYEAEAPSPKSDKKYTPELGSRTTEFKPNLKEEANSVTARADKEIASDAMTLADKAKQIAGSDKSSKAEALRTRALLLKGHANKLKGMEVKEEMSEDSDRYDSYSKEKGYFKSRKK